MEPIEIVLIIVGVILVVISCILVDRSQYTGSSNASSVPAGQNPVSEQEEKQIKERMRVLLDEISEETVVRTDDSLSRLSNEKIMAVNEFSDQILEKIKHNHEEVVFLYNMLNEKDKDLKSTMREIDASERRAREIADSGKEAARSHSVDDKTSAGSISQPDKSQRKDINPQEPKSNGVEENSGTVDAEVSGSNNNAEVLTLYSQGKSVMEIAKLLEMGQGEVKLVIDLFKRE